MKLEKNKRERKLAVFIKEKIQLQPLWKLEGKGNEEPCAQLSAPSNNQDKLDPEKHNVPKFTWKTHYLNRSIHFKKT